MTNDEARLKANALRALSLGTLPGAAPLSFSDRGFQIVLVSAQDPESAAYLKKSRMLEEVEEEILEKFGLGN